MRILGIDPGTAIMGFGIIDAEKGKYKLVGAGVIRTPANQALELRLETIFDDLTEIIAEFKPEEAAVEELFFARNVNTALPVAHARGVAMLAIIQSKIDQGEYKPVTIKQSITGYGQADKNQVQQMVKTMLGLKKIPKPDDAADALAVAITHAMHLGT